MRPKHPLTFEQCLGMMRHRDPETQEAGFLALLDRAADHIPDLAAALEAEPDPGVACWLCELLASTGADDAVPLLAARLADARPRVREGARVWLERMDTRSARIALWRHRAGGRGED